MGTSRGNLILEVRRSRKNIRWNRWYHSWLFGGCYIASQANGIVPSLGSLSTLFDKMTAVVLWCCCFVPVALRNVNENKAQGRLYSEHPECCGRERTLKAVFPCVSLLNICCITPQPSIRILRPKYPSRILLSASSGRRVVLRPILSGTVICGSYSSRCPETRFQPQNTVTKQYLPPLLAPMTAIQPLLWSSTNLYVHRTHADASCSFVSPPTLHTRSYI